MMSLLIKLDTIVGNTLKWCCIAAFVGLFGLLLAVVFIRFVPIAKLSWSDEVIAWLMAVMVFLAAAALWRKRAHFQIEAMAGIVGETLFGRIFFFVIEIMTAVFIGFFAIYSLELTLSVGRSSPILAWPMTWWYATMPIAGFIMLAYSARNIATSFISVIQAFRDRRETGAANAPK